MYIGMVSPSGYRGGGGGGGVKLFRFKSPALRGHIYGKICYIYSTKKVKENVFESL